MTLHLRYKMTLKDITISKERQMKELKIFSFFFGLACLANLMSIFVFSTSLLELFTQLHLVIFLALLGYLALGVLRILTFLVKKGLGKS